MVKPCVLTQLWSGAFIILTATTMTASTCFGGFVLFFLIKRIAFVCMCVHMGIHIEV